MDSLAEWLGRWTLDLKVVGSIPIQAHIGKLVGQIDGNQKMLVLQP